MLPSRGCWLCEACLGAYYLECRVLGRSRVLPEDDRLGHPGLVHLVDELVGGSWKLGDVEFEEVACLHDGPVPSHEVPGPGVDVNVDDQAPAPTPVEQSLTFFAGRSGTLRWRRNPRGSR